MKTDEIRRRVVRVIGEAKVEATARRDRVAAAKDDGHDALT